MLGWMLFGVAVVAIVLGVLLYFRSLRRWHQPPPGPGDEGQSTLTWMTFSQGDQSGGV
jgi:hypothetical protein